MPLIRQGRTPCKSHIMDKLASCMEEARMAGRPLACSPPLVPCPLPTLTQGSRSAPVHCCWGRGLLRPADG